MGNESTVEIPEGSGNQYRYEYDTNTQMTVYRGAVGSAPTLSETEFDELFKAKSKSKKKPKQMKVTILQKGGDRDMQGFVDHEKRAKRHKAIEDATMFYAKELMSTRMQNLLKIRIELRASKLDKDTLGEVGRKLIGSHAQRDFTIILLRDEPDMDEQLYTLAHEMVHVKQVATNELQGRRWVSDRKIHTRWKGEEMALNLEYDDYPWEDEAMVLGWKLSEKWRKERKKNYLS